MQLTRMPLGPSSCASALESAITAPFVAEYAASHDAPTCPHMELTVTIAPACFFSIPGKAARMQWNIPSTFTAKIRRHSSGEMSEISPKCAIPALQTKTSKSGTFANAPCTCASSATSQQIAAAPVSRESAAANS